MARKYMLNRRYNKELELVETEGNTTSITVTMQDEEGEIYLWDTCAKSKAYKQFLELKKATLTFTYKDYAYEKNIIGYVRVE